MDLKLQGKKALVTGASYGLGYGCARMLAAEGVDVALCARDREKLSKAAQTIAGEFGVKTFPVVADLTDEAALARIAASVRNEMGEPDIVVISTGHPPTYPFSAATDEQWRRGYDLIINPAIHLPRAFLDDMKKRGYGRFVFIGSIFGLEPEKSSVVQSTFRTGLNALSKCIATEYAPFGITANVICPGYFDTPLVRNLAGQYAEQDKKPVEAVLDDWKNYAPVHQYGDPDDLGALVAFLASPRGAFVTGTSITMDGGAVRQY